MILQVLHCMLKGPQEQLWLAGNSKYLDISEWSSKAYQNGVEGNGNTVKVKVGCKAGPTIDPVMTAWW